MMDYETRVKTLGMIEPGELDERERGKAMQRLWREGWAYHRIALAFGFAVTAVRARIYYENGIRLFDLDVELDGKNIVIDDAELDRLLYEIHWPETCAKAL